MVYLIGYTQT